MKITILGAGQVGGTLAEHLVNANNDITLVDTDMDRLRELLNRYDLRVVCGHAANPEVLRDAGARDADMLVAVTNSDDTNMVACQIAQTLFHTPKKISRIRSESILKEQEQLFRSDAIPIDHVIAPEQLVTDHIRRLIEYPGALQIAHFAEGKASLVAVRAYYGGSLIGRPIAALREHLPNIDTRIVALFRQGRPISPRGTTVVEADDEIYFVCSTSHIRAVISEFQRLERGYRQIMIVGGGHIGANLAHLLESRYTVKLIEQDPDRSELLSEQLQSSTILCGDAADQSLLSEEHIEQVDMFIAVTNQDEANIMSSMLAKKNGVRRAIALIQNQAYLQLVQDDVIDITISPQQATISELLSHVRRADIDAVFSLRNGTAEAFEAVAHGDSNTSKVVGRAIGKIKLPHGATIGAVIRHKKVLIAHDDIIIEPEDRLLLFLIDSGCIAEVEQLFQPSALYI
ncbi:Trk system potassium transporter TrkA [Dongshaea marina]|uniref:Trk system potassium transporter TrkA n=1 Tax=Dongshaea marina TaxID=2047966 RepID=UPI000D3EC58A|nr:Trk system potassium transporter TrkA [Dongshaea marina]